MHNNEKSPCGYAEDPRLILLGDRGPSRPAEVSDGIFEPRRGFRTFTGRRFRFQPGGLLWELNP